MKVLDYALSPTPNDVSAIKPFYIKTFFEYDEQVSVIYFTKKIHPNFNL